MFFKKYKRKIFALLIAFLILSLAYFTGDIKEEQVAPKQESAEVTLDIKEEKNTPPERVIEEEPAVNENVTSVNDEMAVVTEKKEPEKTPDNEEETKRVCTLVIRCDNILKNTDKIAAEKLSLLPENGFILPETQVTFTEGESVFDLLLRETKRRGIHFEYSETPMYNSVYIEGINNFYEKDCGELSGWLYLVNGENSNFGCSLYILEEGDFVELVYTCDMGRDI